MDSIQIAGIAKKCDIQNIFLLTFFNMEILLHFKKNYYIVRRTTIIIPGGIVPGIKRICRTTS